MDDRVGREVAYVCERVCVHVHMYIHICVCVHMTVCVCVLPGKGRPSLGIALTLLIVFKGMRRLLSVWLGRTAQC